MVLSKEEAIRRADQIIQEEEQKSIAIRNRKAKYIQIPLLHWNKSFMNLEPYQRAQLIVKAREYALDHPVYNKALYVYTFAAIIFLRHILKNSNTLTTLDSHISFVLASGLLIFELYRGYLIYFYLKNILKLRNIKN